MPTEPIWTYDPRTHNYRRNGSFVSFNAVKELALEAAENSGDMIATLATQLVNDQLRLDHWQELMRDALKNEHIAQYMVGRGGKTQMTQRDWGILGAITKKQYQFLDNFAQDIANGNLTQGQIITRARMYIENAHQSLWRGRTESLGMPPLPTYPAYGDTQCLTRCRCDWVIEEVRDPDGALTGWNATWQLDPLAREVHCPNCPELASLWNPLFVPAGMTPTEARAWREAERARMQAAMSLSDFEHKHTEGELCYAY